MQFHIVYKIEKWYSCDFSVTAVAKIEREVKVNSHVTCGGNARKNAVET